MTKNSHEEKSTKCFSGILHMLLCTGSLPTHPSDQFIEPGAKRDVLGKAEVEVKVTIPGVVARLMGLESFPNTPLPPRAGTLGDYFRSRSVNSIDFLANFEPIKQRNYQHRRVRTSVSFPEGVVEDNYGLVICGLKKLDGSNDFLIKKRGCQQLEKKKGVRNEKLHDRNASNSTYRKEVGKCNVVKQEKDFRARTRNLKDRRVIKKQAESKEPLIGSANVVKKKKNEFLACNKVNSHRNVISKVHHGKPQEVSRVKHSRKPPPPQIVNSHYPSPNNGSHCDYGSEAKAMAKTSQRKTKKEECFYYKRMMDEIYKLTVEDLEEDWKLAEFEETFQELGQEILEVLLKQFVAELVLVYVVSPAH